MNLPVFIYRSNLDKIGDFVCEKFVKTKRGDLIKFGTSLDAEGRFFDTVHFRQTLVKCPLRGAGIYLIEGKVVVEYACLSIVVTLCQDAAKARSAEWIGSK